MCHIYAYDVFMEGKIDPRCGVKPNMEVIAGSVSEGDTVFHSNNVPAGTVQTMYPVG